MFIRRNKHRLEVARLQKEAALQAELASAAMAHAAEMRHQTERRIEEAKEAGEQARRELLRTVKTLADEVEFLRMQHFGARQTQSFTMPTTQGPLVPALPEYDFMPRENPHWLSEEEEEVHALRAAGHLDDMEQHAALAQIRAQFGLSPIQIETS